MSHNYKSTLNLHGFVGKMHHHVLSVVVAVCVRRSPRVPLSVPVKTDSAERTDDERVATHVELTVSVQKWIGDVVLDYYTVGLMLAFFCSQCTLYILI